MSTQKTVLIVLGTAAGLGVLGGGLYLYKRKAGAPRAAPPGGDVVVGNTAFGATPSTGSGVKTVSPVELSRIMSGGILFAGQGASSSSSSGPSAETVSSAIDIGAKLVSFL